MKFYIYGAGTFGKKAIENYVKYFRESADDECLGIIDREKCGQIYNYKIDTWEKTKCKYQGEAIIIAIECIDTMKAIVNALQSDNIKNIYWYLDNDWSCETGGKSFFSCHCLDVSEGKTDILPQVEMHIVDGCNLNCRGCTHYSPIFDNSKFPNFSERVQDILKLKDKVDYIRRFYILGGEPFLNPDIAKYAEIVRKVLPASRITIVSNGILIPSIEDDILKRISNANVEISISEYKPTHAVIDKITDKLKNNKVKYEIREYEIKQKFNIPLTSNIDTKFPQLCISNGCVTIWNGKIARCPSLMYIDELNARFGLNLPNEGIYDLNDIVGGTDLINKMNEKVPLCNHCVKNEIEWQVCGKKAVVEDFVSTL